MNEYKLSAETITSIKDLLIDEYNYIWDGTSTPVMISSTDAFVYLGILPDEINADGEIVSYLSGLHFDILTIKEISVQSPIKLHNPIVPKHKFA